MMCGIIACRARGDALPFLLGGLRRLEYRGYDSAGVAVRSDDGAVHTVRSAGRIAELAAAVAAHPAPPHGTAGIGHTRWATHGAVVEDNAHPHTDCTGRIHVVHNGIIDNAAELRALLTAQGHRMSSEVDSAVLPHLIERELAGGGGTDAAVQRALTQVRGSWAIAVLDRDTGGLVAAAHRSPLLVAHSDRGDFIASDITALCGWADDFRVLADGDVVGLGTATRWSNAGAAITPRAAARSEWLPDETGLGGHADYMAKEIAEQPAVAARLLERMGSDLGTRRGWHRLGLPPFTRVEIIACGTSLHAGMVTARALTGLGGFPATVTPASEALPVPHSPGTLTIALSQSGETADVLHALDGSPRTVLAITNTAHSTLARRADAVLTCAAGPEIGVAATKTFVCQALVGAAFALSAALAAERVTAASAAEAAGALAAAPARLAASEASAAGLVPALADELTGPSGFIFLARGAGLPYAAEGALKLKELTYRWAEHYPAGELKHGPLALIEAGTPIIAIDDGDPRMAANLAAAAARGGRIITIGGPGTTLPVHTAAASPCGPLESVVPMQVLARGLALALGRDVDKPRNLAKSVTVA